MSCYRHISSSHFFSAVMIIAFLISVLFACEQFEPERIIKVETDSIINVDHTYCRAQGRIIDMGDKGIIQHGFCWSSTKNPTTGDNKNQLGAKTSKGSFSAHLTGLSDGTKYYVRAYAQNENNIVYGDQKSFTTLILVIPTVTTSPISSLTENSAESGGNITDDGGTPITARGLCWNTQEYPTTDNEIIEDSGTGTGEFISTLTQLENGTVYYARAYATNSVGTSYGNQVRFTTYYGTASDPDGNEYFTVKIGEQEWMASNLRTTKYADGSDILTGLNDTEWTNAVSGAYAIQPHEEMENLNSDEEVLEAYGALYNGLAVQTGKLCPDGWRVATDEDWSQLKDHLINNYEEITEDNIGNYLKSCRQVDSPLEGYFNTSDHPRWNADDKQYGNDYFNFSALPGGARNPAGVIGELGFNALYMTSTRLSSQGGFWLYNMKYHNGSLERHDEAIEAGMSIRCLKGESPVVTLPVLTTSAVTGITESSASCGGEVTDDGGDAVSARGVVWGTTENPTTETNIDSTNDGSGTGTFISEITGLDPATTYYVRAYATNSVGTAYGDQVSFETNPLPPDTEPIVTTAEINNITQNSAIGGGEVTDDGGDAVTSRGVVWGSAENPTTEINIGSTNEGSGTGTFTSEITGLDPATTYYVRAYAVNSIGTAYGNEVEFTTITLPTVSTEAVINIDNQSANSGGNISDNGGDPVIKRGICWHTSSDPTTESNTGFTNDGEGTGIFSSSMTGLEPNTKYYVRAYATNSAGTAYGNQLEFTTAKDPDLPAVTTLTISDITSYTAVSGGDISDQGSSEVLLRGVCWSLSANPTIDDEYTEDGAGTGNYASSITGLYSGTTYYVRAYATNSYGIAYGNELSFTTLPGPPTVEIGMLRSKPGLKSVDADIIRDGGADITERGFVWGTSPDPDLTQNAGYSTEGQGIDAFTGEISGLSVNTDYYIRSWATNSEGTSYSEQLIFHFWDYGTVTDIDGNSYNTVIVGNQVWMAENLRVARYNTAIPIPGGLTDEEWGNTTSGAYAIYPYGSIDGLNSEEEVLEAYGALYNWYAVETDNLCPTGWRVPTDADWTQLKDYINNNYDTLIQATSLRSCRQVDSPLGGDFATSEHPRWKSHDTFGIDFFGFSGLPGGLRRNNGSFERLGRSAYWMSSSLDSNSKPIIYYIRLLYELQYSYKNNGLSIRCIKE